MVATPVSPPRAHVFCDNPLANTIGKSKALRDAVKKAGAVLQTGSHERSRDSVRYCCEVVCNGYIGKLHTMFINLPTDQGYHENVWKKSDLRLRRDVRPRRACDRHCPARK